MLSLHQLRCFLAAYEHGSFTTAATALGLTQPSLSEQIRLLERTLRTTLFDRVGRGVVPTEAARALRPHAETTLAAADTARDAVAAVSSLETGTVRFGMFGAARLYPGAALVADVLERHPGLRVELVGTNSTVVIDELRQGRLQAAVVAIPVVDESLAVRPIARDELVYVSADPARTSQPVTPKRVSEAPLALSDASFREVDSVRRTLAGWLQRDGRTASSRVEVEDVETALAVVQRGLADTVLPLGGLEALRSTVARGLPPVSLRPRLYETIAIVHRPDAVLSPATRLVIELATARIREVAEPVH